MAKIRTVRTLLSSQSNKYHTLFQEGQRLIKANRLLQDMLSKPLNSHACISQIHHDTLHIAVDSAAWLSKARFQVTEIFDDFKQKSGLSQLTQTKFKVHPYLSYADKHTAMPTENTPVYNTTNPDSTKTISSKTLSQINEAAENMQDPELKKAFDRLAKTLKTLD